MVPTTASIGCGSLVTPVDSNGDVSHDASRATEPLIVGACATSGDTVDVRAQRMKGFSH